MLKQMEKLRLKNEARRIEQEARYVCACVRAHESGCTRMVNIPLSLSLSLSLSLCVCVCLVDLEPKREYYAWVHFRLTPAAAQFCFRGRNVMAASSSLQVGSYQSIQQPKVLAVLRLHTCRSMCTHQRGRVQILACPKTWWVEVNTLCACPKTWWVEVNTLCPKTWWDTNGGTLCATNA